MFRGGKILLYTMFVSALILSSATFGFAAAEDSSVQVEVLPSGGTVPPPPPVDTIPPVISNIQVINITSDSVTVTWETDEPASSIIYYGETDSYGLSVIDGNLLTSHSLNITGLDPETLYHFNIWATDASTNTSQSGDNTFTTASIGGLFIPNAPILNPLSTSAINLVIDTNANQADVTYLINETSTGQYLQTDGSFGAGQVWQSYNNWGGIFGKNITGLAENIQYSFQVKARNLSDETDWSASSSAYTYINAPASLFLIDSGPNNIIVRAQGSLPNIGSGLSSLWFENNSTTQISSWIPSITWNNTGLNPATSYSYRVKARNGDGVETDFTSLIIFSTASGLPACADGFDNDNDNLVDYPADPGCENSEDNSEEDLVEAVFQCSDGFDNDNDGLTDYPTDPGCENPDDNDETDEEIIVQVPQCSDGFDNDNDELIDYPADLGCTSAIDDNEVDEPFVFPQCADGLDNDDDGLADYPADPGCSSQIDDNEIDEIIEEIIEEESITEVLSEEIDQIIETILENEAVQFVLENIFDNPKVEEVNEKIGFPAVAAVTALNLVSIASLAGILPYLFFLFSEPILVLFRKKRKKFGVVYDSMTKKPIDLAILRLYRSEDNKLIQTKVSDKQGRYAFIVNPGKYYIKVFKKEYKFPTIILKEQKEDTLYIDLYHGEDIEATEKTTIIPNIPLDPEKEQKPAKKVLAVYTLRKVQKFLALLGPLATLIVLLIKPSVLWLALLVLHILLFILFRRLAMPSKPKSWGMVADKNSKKPLSRAVIRLYDSKYNKLLETQVTDNQGRYGFLAGKNIYYITAERNGYETEKTEEIAQKKPEGEAITRNLLLNRTGAALPPEKSEPKPAPQPKIMPPKPREAVRNLPHEWHGEESAQKMKEKMTDKDFEYKEKSKDINIPWSEQ